jgi:hypothetical protein
LLWPQKKINKRENLQVLANVTQVSDVVHGPLFYNLMFCIISLSWRYSPRDLAYDIEIDSYEKEFLL